MTAIALRAHEGHRRKLLQRRDHLAEARARLHGYVSPMLSLSREEREQLYAYDGPEVSGEIKQQRSR